MQLRTAPRLLNQLRRTWDPTRLAEQLAPLDSPLRLGALLTPLKGAVFRRREGKQRLIFVPRQADDKTWCLVLVDVINRDSGDRQGGRYRRLLDDPQGARQRYLRQLEEQVPAVVPTSVSGTQTGPLAPIPSELRHWTQRLKPLEDDLQPVDAPSLRDAITFQELDASQRELLDGSLRTAVPRFLTGRAGSSKSTLLHHQFARYAALAIGQMDEHVPRFVTRSEHLLEDARRRVRRLLLEEHGYEILGPEAVPPVAAWMATASNYLRQIALRAGEPSENWEDARYISTARFRELYCGRKAGGQPLVDDAAHAFRDFGTRDSLHWAVAWFVIRALIAGYDPATDLDVEDYEELPKRDQTVPTAVFARVHRSVYTNWYRPLVQEKGFWDDQKLARTVIRHPHTELGTSALVCDEAQDLSRVELLALLNTSDLLRYDLTRDAVALPFVFAGDESQTLDLTGFRWASITSGFYELTGAAFGEAKTRKIVDDQLAVNYRSAYEIVQIANAIQERRKHRFSEAEAQHQEAYRRPSGEPVRLVDHTRSPRQAILDVLGLSDVILPCEDGAEHDVVTADPLLKKALASRAPHWIASGEGVPPVYTAQTLKGLELDSAVLYGWGDALLSDDNRPELARRTDYARWYVAVTRARDHLTIIESPEGRKLWDDLDLPDTVLADQTLTEVEDATARLRGLAESSRKRGLATRSPEELFRAAQDFTKLGEREAAIEARAFGFRFQKDHGTAAELFIELGREQEAATDLWTARDWPRLAALQSDHPWVAIARLLTQPENQAAVEKGRAALSASRRDIKETDEAPDLVNDVAAVADRALLGGFPTVEALLDTLAAEPRLPYRARQGLAGIVAQVIAADLDVRRLAVAVAGAYGAAARIRLARWIASRQELQRDDLVAFVAALRDGAEDAALAVATAAGLPTAQQKTAASGSRGGTPARKPPPPSSLTPGDPWLRPRGHERWKLSKQHRKLVRKRDERSLDTLVDAEAAAAFVAAALQVRPDGGSVWVDSDGVAAILVRGELTYLGTLPSSTSRRAAQRSTPSRPLGSTASSPNRNSATNRPARSQLPEVDGWPTGSRRYTLHRRDVSDPATEKTLSSVIGPSAAAAVAHELLVPRPTGGRIYVAPDGRVVTQLDNRYLVIGKVRPEHWFR